MSFLEYLGARYLIIVTFTTTLLAQKAVVD